MRKNTYKYVELNEEGSVQIHFLYLNEHIEQELNKWCNPSQLSIFSDLTETIEDHVNSWLRYCCLEGDKLPAKISERKEIVKHFQKDNNLTNKIVVLVPSEDPGENKRILELEVEISKYAQENQKLESENIELKRRLSASEKEKHLLEQETENAVSEFETEDFLGFLKIVDSKYSFDILRSVQLGDERSITVKNFLAHFFYGLRKKGLTTYPAEEEFELHYDQSGLYQCIGFEVPPDGTAVVKVERYGWALSKKGRILPIRKALLRLA